MKSKKVKSKVVLEPKSLARCVARTFNIEEAHGIATRFQAHGYETSVVENKRTGLILYEVWASRSAEGFEANTNILRTKVLRAKSDLKPRFTKSAMGKLKLRSRR